MSSDWLIVFDCFQWSNGKILEVRKTIQRLFKTSFYLSGLVIFLTFRISINVDFKHCHNCHDAAHSGCNFSSSFWATWWRKCPWRQWEQRSHFRKTGPQKNHSWGQFLIKCTNAHQLCSRLSSCKKSWTNNKWSNGLLLRNRSFGHIYCCDHNTLPYFKISLES